jgi:peptide/nickel transport system substrate-binding protein
MIIKPVAGLAVTLVVALGLAACASVGANPSKATTLIEESNVGVAFTRNFNPFNSNSLSSEMNMRSLTYEPLFEFNQLKPGAIYPWLAKSWNWSNGGKTLSFQLRSGVRWADGTPLTANDVAFTFNLMSSKPAANYSGVPPITSAFARSPSVAVLNFKTPQYANLYAIAGATYIVPRHIWQFVSNPATAIVANPIGSGPYRVEQFSTKLVRFTANPRYWGGKPAVTNVEVPSLADNSAAITALADGKLDWAGNDLPNIDTVYVSRDRKHNHYWFPPGNTVTLWVNVAKGGFLADPKVRQAISAGIDRRQVADDGESGYESPATSSSGLILPNQQEYLTPATSGDMSTRADPAKVAELLLSDGFRKDANGVWAKDGKEISFSIEDPVAFTDYYADAQIIANQLMKVGINATVNGVTTPKWFADAGNGTFDTMIHWGAGGPFPFQQYQNWLDNTLTAPLGTTAPANYGRYSDEATQALIFQYENTNDPGTQIRVTRQLASVVSEQMPVIPLLYGADWNVYSTAHFTGWPTASNPYINPAPNDPELPYILTHLRPVQ